jgi:hypothetical protein
MSREIRLPHHGDRAAPLATVVDAARGLEDAPVVREIVLALAAEGVGTVGAAIELLEAATPTERRALLDAARGAAGLPSTAQVDRERVEVPTMGLLARDERGLAHQSCHEPGCTAQPIDPSTGGPRPVAAKRWYCAAHRAGRGSDMEPWSKRIVFGPSGLVDLAAQEVERAQERAEAERRAHTRAQRRAARALELPALEAEAVAMAAALRPANALPERAV